MKPGRTPCCVPFCKRTAKADSRVDEVICGKHFRMADKRLIRAFRQSSRLIARLAIDYEQQDQKERHRRIDKFEQSDRLWSRIKKQATERAAGI